MTQKESNGGDTMKLADTYMFHTYARFPITLVRGEGCRVWDEDGNEYLDFVGGIAVCALGHSSPVVTRALEAQSRRLVHVSNLYYTRPQAELARLLVENCFADKVFFCNSGAESNEAAIKLARRYASEAFKPEKRVIVCMDNSFHGRTMATLSATGQAKVQKGFDPLLHGFTFVPFNDVGRLEQAMDESVCAVMMEPIQGEGGVVCPSPDYLNAVRSLCDQKDALLIFDEVQVGMGRTGKLFAHEHYGVTPDIMTLAKALGNGLPIGAMLATDAVAGAFGPGSHATTFGGTPLVAAVSNAVVSELLDGGWVDHCREVGDHFRQGLEGLVERHALALGVRGLGLILGLELDIPGGPLVKYCMDAGFLINCAQENILRFLPPLIVGKDEIDSLLSTLDNVLAKAAKLVEE